MESWIYWGKQSTQKKEEKKRIWFPKLPFQLVWPWGYSRLTGRVSRNAIFLVEKRQTQLAGPVHWPCARPSSCSEHREDGYLGTMNIKPHERGSDRLEKETESWTISFMLVTLFPGHQIYLRNKMLLLILCGWVFVKFSQMYLNWINWFQIFWDGEYQLIVSVVMLTRTKYKTLTWLCVVCTVETKARPCWIHQCCGSGPVTVIVSSATIVGSLVATEIGIDDVECGPIKESTHIVMALHI